jgi:hypothetical protein
MPHFRVAHVKHGGLDLIIVPMNPAFGRLSKAAQVEAMKEIQEQAAKAQLAGAVVPVWESRPGRLAFLAPANWHPFFKALTVGRLLELLNRELSW